MLDSIRWHGAASFALLNGTHIYINPRRITRPDRTADMILIGSAHYDQCSPADIDKLRGEHTKILTSPSAASQFASPIVLRPWQCVSVGNACIKGVPIYGADGQIDPSGDLGFVISTSRYDIYYAGRTTTVPEASSLHPDIAILPISGEGSMKPDVALAAVRAMRPGWVVPFGWSGVGRAAQVEAQIFAADVGNMAQVLILEQNP